MSWIRSVLVVAALVHLSATDLTSVVEICFPTFTKESGTHSVGGNPMNSSSLEDCIRECEEDSRCWAFDFDPTEVTECWMHTSQDFKDRVYKNPAKNQFRINRDCQTKKVTISDCPSSWRITKNTQSTLTPSEGRNVSHTSCLSACRFSDTCQGVAYDAALWPPCLLFDDPRFSASANVRTRLQSELDALDRGACPRLTGKRSIGRCAGQSFPARSAWCPVGSVPTLTGVYYRNHPQCCPGGSGLRYPPLDSKDLMTLDVAYLNPAYAASISACASKASCGSFQAISFSTGFPIRSFCPSEYDLYYVAIEFECDLEDFSVSSPSSSSSCDDEVENGRTALVLGAIGLTLGLLSCIVIVCLVLYVCYFKRWKAWLEEKRSTNTRTTSTFNPFFAVDGLSSPRIIKIDDGRSTVTSARSMHV